MSVELWKELAALKKSLERSFVEGTVTDVDPKNARARIRVGGTDDKPVLSPWIPYAQQAGALKGHVPVSKGQQMTMIAPGGNWKRAKLLPMTFSDENKSPSDKGDENVWTYGEAKIELRAGEIVVTVPKIRLVCGGSTFELTGGGLKMVAPDYQFD